MQDLGLLEVCLLEYVGLTPLLVYLGCLSCVLAVGQLVVSAVG